LALPGRLDSSARKFLSDSIRDSLCSSTLCFQSSINIIYKSNWELF
jgi:hypothetical protein